MPRKQNKKNPPDNLPPDYFPIEPSLSREELRQLYSWTLEEAIEAYEKWAPKKNRPGIRGPLERWRGAQELRLWRDRYKSGEKKAVLEGLYLCTLNDLPIPRWCAMGFLAAYRKVRHFEAGSWDQVFGKPHPSKIHLAAHAAAFKKAFLVFYRIQEIRQKNPETPIDEGLFEKVGKEFGIGKTLANKFYYDEKRSHKALK